MGTLQDSDAGDANTSAIRRNFYTPLARPAEPREVRRWWEQRRRGFNLAVGGAVLVSSGAAMFFAYLPPAAGGFTVPWLAMAAFTVIANILYFLGPAADVTFRRHYGTRAYAAGPVLLRYLFAFAVGLALLPVPLVMLGWLARLVL